MAKPAVVSSVGSFLSAVNDPVNRLGLMFAPATPWYLGNADLKGTLLPAFYLPGTKIKPAHEREALRDYRLSAAELTPLSGLYDHEIMISAHMNGFPSRILEWSANPLFALFNAVESMSAAENGRVWVLNPWRLNELTASLSYVPPTNTDLFRKYAVKLDEPDAALLPEATQPLAFRPTRSTRNYNMQNVFWTVFGKSQTPLEELTFFLKGPDEFLTMIHVDKDSKKSIMAELHDLGVTRANFWPGLTSLTRTLAYRYSSNYLPSA
jgi:hypothetical protein